MIRIIAIVAGIALIIAGILLSLSWGFTVDGRYILIAGAGFSILVIVKRFQGGRPA